VFPAVTAATPIVLGTPEFVHGSPETADRHFNIVLLPEGFTILPGLNGGPSELDGFRGLVISFKDALLAAEPFDRMRGAINIAMLKVPSAFSATQINRECNPNLPAGYNTAFGARFCGGTTDTGQPMPRVIKGNTDLVKKTVRAQPLLKNFNHFLVLVNNTRLDGGAADGGVAWLSIFGNWQATSIHELGHQAFRLADEYPFENNNTEHRVYQGAEPVEPNVSKLLPVKKRVWKSKLTVADPNVLTSAPNPNCNPVGSQTQPAVNTVGAFEGARYFLCKIHRPSLNCRMRRERQQFCPVCQQVITEAMGVHLFGNARTRPERSINTLGPVVVFQPEDVDTDPRFLAYETGSGNFTIFSCRSLVNQDDSPVVAQGQIPALWSSLVSTGFTGSPALLATQIGSDRAEIYQVLEDGKRLTMLWKNAQATPSLALPFGVKQVVPFRANNTPHYLDYDFASGSALIRRINLAANTSTLVRTQSFAAGCIGFTAFDLPGAAPNTSVTHFLVYNPLNGLLRIERFDSDQVVEVQQVANLLSQGATKLMPFQLLPEGTLYLLVYTMQSGLLQMYRFRKDLKGLDFVYKETIGSQFFDFDFFTLTNPLTTASQSFYLRYRFPIQRGKPIPQFLGSAAQVAAFHAG
jgi:hypothetical protein